MDCRQCLGNEGRQGWGMKFVLFGRVGLTQGTMNNQNGAWRGVLASGFVPWRTRVREGCANRGWLRKVCIAGRSVSRTGWGEKCVWATAGGGGPVSPVDGSTSLPLHVAKFTQPQIHFESWRCLPRLFPSKKPDLIRSQGQGPK